MFADEFDFEILDPEDAYRFLLARDELRHGWRPRGRYHTPPSEVEERFGVDAGRITVPPLSTEGVRSDYNVEWIAGVFDGVCRFRPHVFRSSEHTLGYGLYPIARLHRTGVHPSFVDHFRRFCDDYNLRSSDSSDETNLLVVFNGASAVRRVLDILFPRLLVLAELAAVLTKELFPRFDDEEHHTRQGFYRLLCDFDPIAHDSGGPFRHREYDPDHFARIWSDALDSEGEPVVPESEREGSEEVERELPDELESLTVSPAEFRGEPGRYHTLLDRFHRDEGLAEELKALYGDRCQLCGDRLARGDGTGYSEVHHLRPLGHPHEGPDAHENMLVLCPNHHADFDNGVIMIDPTSRRAEHPYDSSSDGEELLVAEDHELATRAVQYHNEVLANLGRAEREELG